MEERYTMNMSKVIQGLRYNYPKSNHFNDTFFNMKAYIAEKAFSGEIPEKIAENLEKGENANVQAAFNFVDKMLIKGREILDFSENAEKGLDGAPEGFLSSIEIKDDVADVKILFNESLKADVYQFFGRGSSNEIKGLSITPDTEFSLRRKFNSYWEEGFGIAFRNENFWLAIKAEASGEGIKGLAMIKVIVYTDEKYIIDDAAKYFDVTPLIKGLSV